MNFPSVLQRLVEEANLSAEQLERDCGPSNLNPGIRRCHLTGPSGKIDHRRR